MPPARCNPGPPRSDPSFPPGLTPCRGADPRQCPRDRPQYGRGRHAGARLAAALARPPLGRRTLSRMLPAAGPSSGRSAALGWGTLAGPLFVTAFTAIGARRPGYDWRRLPVSSLALGHHGWVQRANFMVAGALYCCASRELGRGPGRRVGPRAVPLLVGGVGIGLVGSGVFVTDPVGRFPPPTSGEEKIPLVGAGDSGPTLGGRLHNLFATPSLPAYPSPPSPAPPPPSGAVTIAGPPIPWARPSRLWAPLRSSPPLLPLRLAWRTWGEYSSAYRSGLGSAGSARCPSVPAALPSAGGPPHGG